MRSPSSQLRRWPIATLLAVLAAALFSAGFGLSAGAANADTATDACNYTFDAKAGDCGGAANYRATKACQYAFDTLSASDCVGAADTRARAVCKYAFNEPNTSDCTTASDARTKELCRYTFDEQSSSNCIDALENRTETTCDKHFDEPYDNCLADASARTTAALTYAGLGSVPGTATGAVGTGVFVVGAAPGIANNAGASTWTSTRQRTISQADGTTTLFDQTYVSTVGGPNEQVSSLTVGYITQADATFQPQSDGSVAVLDAANNTVDVIVPPTVVINGSDTVTTTLVPVGNRLDAVLEQPFTGSGKASFQAYGYYPGTAGEKTWCIGHPSKCLVARQLSEQALASAANRFPLDTLEDGKGDSYRHCYWNGLLTVRYDAHEAKGFGDRHEGSSPRGGETKTHFREARAMDLYNNAVGRKFGSKNGANSSTVFYDCLGAAKAGRLRTIQKGTGKILTRGSYDVDDNLYP